MKKLLLVFGVVLMSLPMMVMAQCGTNLIATDQDGTTYQSLKVGPHCWMQTNLKTNVSGSMIYRSDMYPDTTANLAIFGRLYPWAVASNPNTIGEHNFVKGVCPEGWHLPLPVEAQQLSTNRASAVRSTEHWLIPGNNTTGFSLQPGGFYNNGTLRCENLRGEAYFWSVGSNNEPVEVWSDCHCERILLNPGKVNNALSVRCVYKIYQAQVATEAATDIKAFQANLNGNVVFAGYDENFTKGFVYGTDMYELSNDTAQLHQAAEGQYSFKIENLESNTIYYYRAYVVNEFDTVYGAMRIFTTLPIVDTIAFHPNGGQGTMDTIFVTHGEQVTLPANGFTHDGDWEFTGWNDACDGTGNIYSVAENITFNGNITLYAQWHTWCTGNPQNNELGTSRIDSVKDHENNWYKVVRIGSQCWLKENLRTTTEPNGGTIVLNADSNSNITPMAYSSNVAKYGYLYNFAAAMNIADDATDFSYPHRGICPNGWHIPTNEEWTTLAAEAGVDINDGAGAGGAGKLAGGNDWNDAEEATAPGNYNYTTRDSTGFFALPAGYSYGLGDYGVGGYAYFWSATSDESIRAYSWFIVSDYEYISNSSQMHYYGSSLRCLRDAEASVVTDTIAFLPNGGQGTMDTMFVTRGNTVLNANTFTHSGNWHFLGWNTEADGSGTAYANQASLTTNGNLTLYAQWGTYCAGTPRANELGTSRVDSVKDVDNNKYAVVQIGNQCWMRQNLRTNVGGGVYPENKNQREQDSILYGRLYTWTAMMNGASSTNYPVGSTAADTIVHGICPAGWHVPSASEWNALVTYVKGVTEYKCGGDDDPIAKALSFNMGWKSSTQSCAPGESESENNLTGFSAFPAGYYSSGTKNFSKFAYFWSATQHSENEAVDYYLQYIVSKIESYRSKKDQGESVRCLRDNEQ